MPILEKYAPTETFVGYTFFCPGCLRKHMLWTASPSARWEFNGDEERPTFSPSFLIYPDPNNGQRKCHLTIKDGQIVYWIDSDHRYAGKTVDMVDVSGKKHDRRRSAQAE